MNRRRFSATLAGLAMTPLSAAARSTKTPKGKKEPPPPAGPKTFSVAGKELRPFRGIKEAVLMDHPGKGYLSHMWFTGDSPQFDRMRVRVYVDGEATASIDMELGMGTGYSDSDGPWASKFAGKTGSPGGIFNFYRIPFSKNVKVTAELPAGAPDLQAIWWILRGVENAPLEFAGVKLPENARLKLYTQQERIVKPLEEFDLFKTDRPGMIFQVSIAAKSGNFEYMESMIRAYFDGSDEPQFLSSGLEDYFLGAYYFNRGIYHLPESGLTHKQESDSSFSAYRYHDLDPIFFDKGLRLTCRCGERAGERTFGAKGDPMDTTYTTYVWAYEW